MSDALRPAPPGTASGMVEGNPVPRWRGASAVRLDDTRPTAGRAPSATVGDMVGEPSDESLYRSARRGDARAFALLYERYRDPLFRFLVGSTSDRALAEDVLQDAFVAVMTRGPMGPAVRPFRFRPYLYRTALNRAVDIRRRTAREVATAPSDLPGGPSVPTSFTDRIDTAQAIDRTMAQLSAEQRLAISLHYFADLPVADIARLLGQPVGTVKTRLARSYPRLLAALGKKDSS